MRKRELRENGPYVSVYPFSLSLSPADMLLRRFDSRKNMHLWRTASYVMYDAMYAMASLADSFYLRSSFFVLSFHLPVCPKF